VVDPPGAAVDYREPPEPGPRHLTFENLDTYWAARLPVEIPVPGEPVCRLRLDPGHDEISLLTPLIGVAPDLSRFRNIELDTFTQDAESWVELRVKPVGALHAAYGLFTSITDRIQLMSESLAVAVARSIAGHRLVLAGRFGLSEEQEIGLYGELLVVESLLQRRDRAQAIATWHGPLSEEHDFTFLDGHVEVKTTTGERRRHLIGALGQLEPIRGIPLWLLSIQITRSSGADGRTLTQLVRDVRRLADDLVVQLDDQLAAAGWDDDLHDLFTTVWAQRSIPRCYRVDESFPALTGARLAQVVPHLGLVSDVLYRVDVTDLEHSTAPRALAFFVATDRGTQ
jgi:hypothetical protein